MIERFGLRYRYRHNIRDVCVGFAPLLPPLTLHREYRGLTLRIGGRLLVDGLSSPTANYVGKFNTGSRGRARHRTHRRRREISIPARIAPNSVAPSITHPASWRLREIKHERERTSVITGASEGRGERRAYGGVLRGVRSVRGLCVRSKIRVAHCLACRNERIVPNGLFVKDPRIIIWQISRSIVCQYLLVNSHSISRHYIGV